MRAEADMHPNANGWTRPASGHHSAQPIIIARKAPKILKPLSGNLGRFKRLDETT